MTQMRFAFPALVVVGSCIAAACAQDRMSTVVPTTPAPTEQPACAVALSVAPVEFPAAGGTATVRMVATRADCGWSLQTPAWVSLASTGGSGSAEVMATLGVGTEARSDAIRLLNQAVTISQAAAPESDRLGFSLAKCYQARAGAYTPLACVVEVREGRNPASTGVTVTVDRSPFGGSSESRLSRFMGSYDMDLNVPAGFPRGMVGITFTVTDDQGRRSVVTVPLEIT